MHEYAIYYEPADSDQVREFLGTLWAETMSDALHLASQWFEIAEHDLIAIEIKH